MNKMKTLIMVIIGFVVAALVAGLLLTLTKNDLQGSTKLSDEDSAVTVEDIEQELLFINIYEWHGYDTRINGYVVDKNGRRYDFDFSSMEDASPEEIFKEAQDSLGSLESSDFIDNDDIPELYSSIYNIDKERSFDENTADNVMGTYTLYAITYENDKLSLVKVYSYGEQSAYPKDSYAKSIYSYFQEKREE